jgi:alpha-aminoadipic semialdehyde synthase
MPKNTIAIRREDLSKTGERRVALTPHYVKQLTSEGTPVIVQPKLHPSTGTDKRAYEDSEYQSSGATISEDILAAKVIVGLKEIHPDFIYPERTYLCFSHTHKGQLKNRAMLSVFKQRKTTLIDYELMTDEKNVRTITAFTYFAGYAGMIESLWTLGQRYAHAGIDHPLSKIPQSIALQDLDRFKQIIAEAGREIMETGTPESEPPLVVVFLGSGKTSTGAQVIFDLLPVEEIQPEQLEETFHHGGRKKVYKLVLSIHEMFKLRSDLPPTITEHWGFASNEQITDHYFQEPNHFESNLGGILPYTTLVMNCVLWSPRYPRLITRDMMKWHWKNGTALRAIGDISCDPEGSVEFSRETWVDAPVYIYHPEKGDLGNGLEGDGIAVMAVTNLPCAFSADASQQFATDLAHLLPSICGADYENTLESSGLHAEVKKAVIMWQGEFTPNYAYMKEYLIEPVVM